MEERPDQPKRDGIGRALILSVLLHAALLGTAYLKGAGGSGQPGEEGQNGGKRFKDRGDIVEKQQGEERKPVQVEVVDSIPTPEPPKAPHRDDPCPDYFGGIGITMSLDVLPNGNIQNVVVAAVHAGYPAAQMGLQRGDVLLNVDQVRGDIGAPVTVLVRRNGQVLQFSGYRDKICTSGGGE